MHINNISQLIPILQTAIGPVILISGIGLLLLTMTNRLGRAIDRARILAMELKTADKIHYTEIESQLHILWRRAKLIRLGITFASISGLSAALIVTFIFFSTLWNINSQNIIISLFSVCMLSLIVSLILFTNDIYQSLSALKLELNSNNISIS